MTCKVVIAHCKYASETLQRGFDLTPYSTKYWQAGMIVSNGYSVRPAPTDLGGRYGPDGYEYEAQISGVVGQAARREPRWSADPVQDGSIQWVRKDISAASLWRTVVAPLDIEWIDPAGMTITLPVFVIGTVIQIAAHHAGGIEGETHRVIARVPYSDGSIEDYGIDWMITPSA